MFVAIYAAALIAILLEFGSIRSLALFLFRVESNTTCWYWIITTNARITYHTLSYAQLSSASHPCSFYLCSLVKACLSHWHQSRYLPSISRDYPWCCVLPWLVSWYLPPSSMSGHSLCVLSSCVILFCSFVARVHRVSHNIGHTTPPHLMAD